jgi:hypothetical protein
MQMIPSIGSGDYCFANSLHMSLAAGGAPVESLPSTGFLECLTTLPFGYTPIDHPLHNVTVAPLHPAVQMRRRTAYAGLFRPGLELVCFLLHRSRQSQTYLH